MSTLRTYRGDTPTFRFNVVDADGAPLELSGYEATFTVVPRLGEEAVIVKTDADMDVVDNPGGILDVPLDEVDTDLGPGDYSWDMEVRFPDAGLVFTVDSGLLMVKADISQSGS